MAAEPMLRAPRPEIVPESITLAPLPAASARAAQLRPGRGTHASAASSMRIVLLLEPIGPGRRLRSRRVSGKRHRRRWGAGWALLTSASLVLVEALGPLSRASA